MGSLFQTKCYSSNSEAADVYYSSQPIVVVPGETMYMAQYSKVGTNWNVAQYTKTGTSNWTLQSTKPVPFPAFPECNPSESFNDGMVIGWGIAAAMIAVWSVTHIRKGLFR